MICLIHSQLFNKLWLNYVRLMYTYNVHIFRHFLYTMVGISANRILIYCSSREMFAVCRINAFCNVNILSKWCYKLIAQRYKMSLQNEIALCDKCVGKNSHYVRNKNPISKLLLSNQCYRSIEAILQHPLFISFSDSV